MTARSETGYRETTPNGAGPNPDAEDHYSLLGVPFTATHAEITRAYRRAMKRAHPDRHLPEHRVAAEALARQVNAAYMVLADPVKRLAYDRTIRQQVIQDQIMRQYVGGFQTFDDVPGPAQGHRQRQPTAEERRQRAASDRQAMFILVLVSVGITLVILAAVVLGAIFGSALEAVR